MGSMGLAFGIIYCDLAMSIIKLVTRILLTLNACLEMVLERASIIGSFRSSFVTHPKYRRIAVFALGWRYTHVFEKFGYIGGCFLRA